MTKLASGPRGAQSLKLRLTVEGIIRRVRPRDALSQIAAVYNWFLRRYQFVRDPIPVELVKDPVRILEEIQTHGHAMGDCDDASTFLVAALLTIGIPGQFVRVGFKPKTRENVLSGASKALSHVYAIAQDQYGRGIVLDPVAGERTTTMLGQATYAKIGI
jgi:transglutaminase-like putative cysteine protease